MEDAMPNSKFRLQAFLRKTNERYEIKKNLYDIYDRNSDSAINEIFNFLDDFRKNYSELMEITPVEWIKKTDLLIGVTKGKRFKFNIKPNISISIESNFIISINEEYKICGNLHLNSSKENKGYMFNSLDGNWYDFINGKPNLSSPMVVNTIIDDLVTMIEKEGVKA